jgi:hypothetical protein
MAKHKMSAVAILFVLGSILALVATWDAPEDQSAQTRVSTVGA